jgi:signal transduction histidine kinase
MAIIDRALQQVRELSLDLRPMALDDLGLVAALRWYVDREAQRAGLAPEFSAGDLERLPPELETACFRIAQEALTNVVRHAKAKHLRVELSQSGDELHLVVRDDGIGFDPAAIGGGASDVKLGQLGMRERALIVGGTIEVVSAPGKGTEVHARFPLKRSGQISRVGS